MERYEEIANQYAKAIRAGEYDRPDMPFPALREIRAAHGIALATAQRVIGLLTNQGLVITRKGARTLVLAPELRTTDRTLTGRYARARAAQGLIFSADTLGTMTKETIGREWVVPPKAIAELLRTGPKTKVLRRESRTYVDGTPTEQTAMFFPRSIVKDVPALDEDPDIKVLPLIENTGRQITGTANSVRVRHPTEDEMEALSIAAAATVFEHTHGTYDADDEPVEAVINVYPTAGTTLTFSTFEGPMQ